MQVKLVSLSPYSLRLQEIATTAAGRRIKRLFKVGAWGRLLCLSPSHSSPGIPPEPSSGARPKCYTICYHLHGSGACLRAGSRSRDLRLQQRLRRGATTAQQDC